MAFFSKPVMTKKRRKVLDSFLSNTVKALKEMRKEEKNRIVKDLFDLMTQNVARTPIYFYPRKILRANFYSQGGRIEMGVTQGENVSYFKIIQIGGTTKIERKSFINLPSEHVFDGDKMTLNGLLTLCHEYAHFPKPKLGEFAKKFGLGSTQAEELLADMLSAKLAVKMGFPKKEVVKHFSGREIVYGRFPFKEFISKATA